MAIRNKADFFDTSVADRFNTGDIPTEQTFRDYADSVPFKKELGDASQEGQAGISKTTTDARVNSRDNTDTVGVSPFGFPTFVTPAQLSLLSAGTGITFDITPRGGAGLGSEIEDITINADSQTPTNPEVDIPDHSELDLGASPCSDAVVSVTTGTPSVNIQTAINDLYSIASDQSQQIFDVLQIACSALNGGGGGGDGNVEIGDIILSVIPPAQWDASKWREPNGQLLDQSTFSSLFALIGTSYGGGGSTFALPNKVDAFMWMIDSNSARPINGANSNGGTNQINLSTTNLPSHGHSFSGTTTTNGAHFHTNPLQQATGVGTNANVARGGNAGGLTPFSNIPTAGNHNHTFSGTTDTVGDGIPLNFTPIYKTLYLKMRVA